MIISKLGPIPVKDVEIHSTTAKVNLTATVDGPAMTTPLKERWSYFQITLVGFLELRLSVRIVEVIKVMYLMTAPQKQACDIVLIPPV